MRCHHRLRPDQSVSKTVLAWWQRVERLVSEGDINSGTVFNTWPCSQLERYYQRANLCFGVFFHGHVFAVPLYVSSVSGWVKRSVFFWVLILYQSVHEIFIVEADRWISKALQMAYWFCGLTGHWETDRGCYCNLKMLQSIDIMQRTLTASLWKTKSQLSIFPKVKTCKSIAHVTKCWL